MQVSLFNGFADKNPKPITIREVVEIIRADQRLQVLTENHRRYRAAGDTARADAEKEHMPCYSVAVQFSGGKQQKHIVSFKPIIRENEYKRSRNCRTSDSFYAGYVVDFR